MIDVRGFSVSFSSPDGLFRLNLATFLFDLYRAIKFFLFFLVTGTFGPLEMCNFCAQKPWPSIARLNFWLGLLCLFCRAAPQAFHRVPRSAEDRRDVASEEDDYGAVRREIHLRRCCGRCRRLLGRRRVVPSVPSAGLSSRCRSDRVQKH